MQWTFIGMEGHDKWTCAGPSSVFDEWKASKCAPLYTCNAIITCFDYPFLLTKKVVGCSYVPSYGAYGPYNTTNKCRIPLHADVRSLTGRNEYRILRTIGFCGKGVNSANVCKLAWSRKGVDMGNSQGSMSTECQYYRKNPTRYHR